MEERRKRLGVIGHPITHSLSPVMQKAALAKMGLSYSYDSFDVTPEALGAFIEYAENSQFLGLNVTLPHKASVIEHLDELSNEAKLIGAVNTIKFSNGRALGYNTDGIGFIESLSREGVGVKGRKMLIFGAGGAARAIAFQSLIEGAEVSIANRHRERAEELSKGIKSKLKKKVPAFGLQDAALSGELAAADIIVNATTAGMYPDVKEEVVPADVIPPGKIVVDIVYNPLETRFLSEAKQRGCRTINGVGMLVHQGALSIRIWLGIDAPEEAMKEAVLAHLSKR